MAARIEVLPRAGPPEVVHQPFGQGGRLAWATCVLPLQDRGDADGSSGPCAIFLDLPGEHRPVYGRSMPSHPHSPLLELWRAQGQGPSPRRRMMEPAWRPRGLPVGNGPRAPSPVTRRVQLQSREDWRAAPEGTAESGGQQVCPVSGDCFGEWHVIHSILWRWPALCHLIFSALCPAVYRAPALLSLPWAKTASTDSGAR